MKPIILFLLLALAACSASPPQFSKPGDDAQVWNLNAGLIAGTNDMIHEPNWRH
jgi:hypothetical protein